MESRFITDESSITVINKIKRSVFIEGREWFDKTGGNSYFSARIQVDGKWVATLPFQYGYGDSYIYEATTVLKEMGYLPDDTSALWVHAQDMGFDYYAVLIPAKKSEMFKEAK